VAFDNSSNRERPVTRRMGKHTPILRDTLRQSPERSSSTLYNRFNTLTMRFSV